MSDALQSEDPDEEDTPKAEYVTDVQGAPARAPMDISLGCGLLLVAVLILHGIFLDCMEKHDPGIAWKQNPDRIPQNKTQP